MAKLTLTDLGTTLANTAANVINNNDALVEAAFENTLSRDGTAPNQMEADFDLNNNDLLNAGILNASGLVLDGSVVTPNDLSTVPSTVMLKATYDPNNVGQNIIIDRRYQGDFNTEADFTSAVIPSVIQVVTTAGYYSPGDGGGHLKIRIATPSPTEAWHKQSADGAWWEIGVQKLSPRMFGARIDATTDDATAINSALEYGALVGEVVVQPYGISMVGSTIVLKDNAQWRGENYNSTVKKLSSFNGAIVKTENFDTLTGTSDAFDSTVPERVSIEEITFDGNYQNATRTAYIQSSGEGLRLFMRKLRLKARVFNMQGVGVWTECPGGNGPIPLTPGFSREADVNLYIHSTQYEGLIWKGPPDVSVGWILQADAGARIAADEDDGKVDSPTYGASNGNQTFGIVVDGIGMELGTVHSFGNLGGGGIDLRGAARVNAEFLMVETCRYGGFHIRDTVRGMIGRLDIHRTGGFDTDTTEDFIYNTSGTDQSGVTFGTINIYRNNAAHTTSRNATKIDGDFLNVGTFKIEMDAMAGHGLVINYDTAQWINISNVDIARCQGTAPDASSSAGIYRNGSGNGSSINILGGLIRDCSVGFKSAGTPRVETIRFNFFLSAGQTIFSGDVKANIGQEWQINGVLDGVQKTSRFMGVTTAFVSNNTTEQTLTVAHNLIYTPPFGKYINTGILDTATDMSTGDVAYVSILTVDATNITVVFRMATADAVDTAPRVGVLAEI